MGGGETLSASREVQPKHLGVSGTGVGGNEEFGERDEDDPGGKLIGTHFRAHLHQTNPPVLLFMSAVPAFLPSSRCLCLSFCLPLALSEELSLPRPPQPISDGRRATVFINTGFGGPAYAHKQQHLGPRRHIDSVPLSVILLF